LIKNAMNINNNGRTIATTSLLLLVTTMIIPAAFAQQTTVASSSPGNLAINVDLEKGICGEVDLMFVIDDTGSMGGAIENVKTNLPSIITQANSADLNSARVGLITFQDDVTVLHDLSATQADVITSIGLLAAGGGGGFPEASNEAKNTAINNLGSGARLDINSIPGNQNGDNATPWQTPGADKVNIMVLITDNESGGFSDASNVAYQTQMGTLGTDALAKGIHVSDVYVAADESLLAAVNPMKADASNSGGQYIFTAGGVDTAQAIINIIADCVKINPPSTVAGELLQINSTSLFISGLFTNSFWMLPAMAGIAGTGAYVIRSRMHKD
jgi:hypothetical protein